MDALFAVPILCDRCPFDSEATMLDNPEKTTKLLAALKAAVPFEVELTEQVVNHLRSHGDAVADKKHHTVANLSYAGDEGGIVCHMTEALVVSLTHVRVPRSMSLAAAVADYRRRKVFAPQVLEGQGDAPY
jgi:hypothetical protein